MLPKKLGCCGMLLLVLFLAVALIFGLAVYGHSNVLGEIDRVEGTQPPLDDDQIEELENATDDPNDLPEDLMVEEDLDIQLPDSQDVLPDSKDLINILLIGQDRRPGEGRTRSDTMILCTINTRNKTLVMTSFLRDLYVDIPDWNGRSYQDNRLNACYAFGGMGMLDVALKNNFGVQVDHNIEVDFSGFKDVIDIFGGVTIRLTAAEAEYLGGGLKEGANHLTPSQALDYARIRKLDSDFGRASRQQKVLMALFAEMADMNSDQLTKLFRKILPLTTTDMTDGEITDCLVQLLPVLPELKVTTQTIPASGTYKNASVRGMAVLVPDLEANRQILRETLK